MRRINSTKKKTLKFQFEQKNIKCKDGDSVAAALLASGEYIFRLTSQSASSRGPYCMMGVCFDCLVEINGLPNQQACMIKAKSGMTVNRQIGPPSHGLSKVGGRSIK